MSHQDARFEINLGTEVAGQPVERTADGPFRIAILGNFSGRSTSAAGADTVRRVMRIDRDEIDPTIAAIAPELRLVIDPDSAPVVIRFTELEDFHPDRLAERLPIFQSLLELRRDASSSPARPIAKRETRAPSAASSASALAEGSLLDMILDASPQAASPSAGAKPADELTDFVRQAVRPHAVHQTPANQTEIVAKIDGVLESLMRVVLHHPDFQALEALWRATEFFVRRLDTDADLQVYLVDASSADAAADLDGDWSLIVAGFTVGPNDLDLMARLAAVGRSLGAPLLLGASSALAGSKSFATDTDPDDWQTTPPAGWDALRRSADAPYLGLALPRFFLRLPYGRTTDACTFAPFEEIAENDRAAHESYLWGNGAIACALIIAAGVEDRGAPATHGMIDRLPLHVETIDGDARSVPCTEAVLGVRAVTRLLDLGMIPLESMRDGDVVRASRIQSVALPPRALAVRSVRSE